MSFVRKTLLARGPRNFAGAYNSMTNLMTEIYPECEEILGRYCLHVDNFSSDWMVISAYRPSELMLSDAGKIMGYAAFAAERETTPAIREVVTKHLDQALGHATFEEGKRNQSMPHGSVPREMLKLACESIDNQHLLAAELQRQWQQRSSKVCWTNWKLLWMAWCSWGAVRSMCRRMNSSRKLLGWKYSCHPRPMTAAYQ